MYMIHSMGVRHDRQKRGSFHYSGRAKPSGCVRIGSQGSRPYGVTVAAGFHAGLRQETRPARSIREVRSGEAYVRQAQRSRSREVSSNTPPKIRKINRRFEVWVDDLRLRPFWCSAHNRTLKTKKTSQLFSGSVLAIAAGLWRPCFSGVRSTQTVHKREWLPAGFDSGYYRCRLSCSHVYYRVEAVPLPSLIFWLCTNQT